MLEFGALLFLVLGALAALVLMVGLAIRVAVGLILIPIKILAWCFGLVGGLLALPVVVALALLLGLLLVAGLLLLPVLVPLALILGGAALGRRLLG